MTDEEQLAAVADGVLKLRQWFEAKVARCDAVMERSADDHLFAVESEKTWCEGVLRMMDEFGLGVDEVPNPLAKTRVALKAAEGLIRWELQQGLTQEHRACCEVALTKIKEAF